MPSKYDHINFKPPSGVRAEAQKGLDWRSEFGRGGTGVGIARARDLSNGVTISPETARRMKAFFDRHQSDKTGQGWSPGEKGFPSNGRIAHALWGGDAGYAWSRKLVKQMNAADEARSVAEFLEERGFCATGSGGGIDNSCATKVGSSAPQTGGGVEKAGKDMGKFKAPGGVSWHPTDKVEGTEVKDKAKFKKATGLEGHHENFGHQFVPVDRDSPPSVTLQKKGWKAEANYENQTPYGTKYVEVFSKGNQVAVVTHAAPLDNYHAVDVYEGKYNESKFKGSKTRGGKKKRSHEMQIETRSLCLDDFSEDDAFPLLRIERRCCEERADGPEESWLVGYAARFGVNSLKMDDFYERIDPSAFNIVTERRGRKSPLETRALFNHDPNHVLGRFPSTLRMKVDEHGLRYEIKMPESRRDLIESIERGDIRGSSFSFIVSPGGEDWSVEEGRSIRTVKSIASLIDVGPVTFPAYPDASVSVAQRSYDEFMRSRQVRAAELDAIRGHRAEIQKFLRERGR